MILPLDQQCAPLALCRRLKELGAPRDSMFTWQRTWDPMARSDKWVVRAYGDPRTADLGYPSGDDYVAAYTVAELGAMLPDGMIGPVSAWMRRGSEWFEAGENRVAWPTEAAARAALLIRLIEVGVVKFGVTFPTPAADWGTITHGLGPLDPPVDIGESS